jgi:hypothetical protein
MTLMIATVVTFLACFVLLPVVFWLLRFFGFYAIVEERTCYVYVLFGKVVAVIDEPGLHILLFKLGLKAPIVRWLGRVYSAASQSTPKRARPWASASGTKCSSAIPQPSSSRMPIRGAH